MKDEDYPTRPDWFRSLTSTAYRWSWPVKILASIAVVGLVVTGLVIGGKDTYRPSYHVAFIGNSMQYYNDFPRFMEALSGGTITQNSCLHGDANLRTILIWGNGMYKIWTTGSARIFSDDKTLYDMGACTVPQLLLGYDADLEEKVGMYGEYVDGDDDQVVYAFDDDNIQQTDDYMSYKDGKNPCQNDLNYYEYLQYGGGLGETGRTWDFIVMNDNTRAPARRSTRTASLQVLESTYVDWFLETGATPVFICTYGYWTPYRDMGGFDDVANFTSLTYQGYREYAELLESYLPQSQKPRLALVGHAFLLVYEENYDLWQRLFHVDKIHASPLGTYLQGLVVYYSLYGKMPLADIAIDTTPSNMWQEARRFQPGKHRRSTFPTIEEAGYLYDVATRVMRYGVVPRSLILYEDGVAADFQPSDDLYRVDDLF